jgi:cytochrome P450
MVTTSPPLADEVTALFECRPDLIADRYRLYRRLREEAPVLRAGPQVVLSRFADIHRTHLLDQDFHKGASNLQSTELMARYERLPDDQKPKMLEFFDFRSKWVTAVNGTDHIRLRTLAHKSFTPRILAGIQARIEEITSELLDVAAASGDQVDLIAQFAWTLPLIVISEMLDVPTDARDDIRRWSMDVASFTGGGDYGVGLEAAYPSMFALKAHLKRVFDSRRGGSTTDLMGALLAAETEQGDRFSEDELVGMIAQLIWAGHETTTNLIGNGMWALLSNPEQWRLLRDDPELTPNAVEEILRYLSPTQITRRMAVEDTQIGDFEIPKYQTVMFLLGAANRDPEQFADPERFDIQRQGNKHLAFGLGPHFCLGAALARMEGNIALRALVTRFPDMKLATDKVKWNANTTFCALTALPISPGRNR